MPLITKAEALALATEEWERLPARYDGCVMCAIADSYRDDLEVLASNPGAVAVLDRYATRSGHVIVVLRRHAASMAELGWDDYAAVQRLAWEAGRAVDRALRPMRVFVAALGSTAKLPNTFAHHHVHVIPIAPGTEDRPARVLSWESGVHVYTAGEAAEVAGLIRASWPPERDR